ncbi:MAG: sigma-70 family RNA polymerase sigma factor, partial [Clostridia bacterium]|nr:sigma-70 family RNA polymerase sigma factor [Clostridia bacterium]
YGGPILFCLVRPTGNRSDAEELMNDIFHEALSQIERFDGRISLQTWLRKRVR